MLGTAHLKGERDGAGTICPVGGGKTEKKRKSSPQLWGEKGTAEGAQVEERGKLPTPRKGRGR